MLAYLPYMDPMGYAKTRTCFLNSVSPLLGHQSPILSRCQIHPLQWPQSFQQSLPVFQLEVAQRREVACDASRTKNRTPWAVLVTKRLEQ